MEISNFALILAIIVFAIIIIFIMFAEFSVAMPFDVLAKSKKLDSGTSPVLSETTYHDTNPNLYYRQQRL
jgi:hypothetical protein